MARRPTSTERVLLVALGLAGCSGSGSDRDASSSSMAASASASGPTATTDPAALPGVPLRLDLIAEAIAAVDAARGGPQHFFEVNATAQLVNLFALDEGSDPVTATAYVFRPGGGLDPPAAPLLASGPTFSGSAVRLGATVLDRVLEELPTSLPTLFAVTAAPGAVGSTDAAPGDGVEMRVYLVSTQGGQVTVLVSPTGEILGTDIDR